MDTNSDIQKIHGLHIGTSGWSYKHWQGVFYPDDVTQDKYLEYYITQFDCVELNSCFYHLPYKSTVTGWMRRTPADFRFCTKLSRYITHQKYLQDIEEPLKNFFNDFHSLHDKMGPVLVQLPPGLSYHKDRLCDLLAMVKELYSAYRFAVEVRNPSWICDEFFELLKQYNIGFVIADSGGQFPFAEVVTTDFVYLRFYGKELLYASDYSDDDLTYYAGKIKNWLNEGKEVWAFFNNDYGGFAPRNARKLEEIIYAKR